jgi:hypothetical protein
MRGADATVMSRRRPRSAQRSSAAVAMTMAMLWFILGFAPRPAPALGAVGGSSLLAFGYNDNGQIGDGTTDPRLTPVAVNGMDDIVAIDAGFEHSLALRSDGRVYAWGLNDHGQLGDGTQTRRLSPILVPGLTHVTAIGAGGWFSLAIRSDGSVWQWGAQRSLMATPPTLPDILVPAPIATTNAIGGSLGAGGGHRLVVSSTGVQTWGDNSKGQLVDGTTTHNWTPATILDPPDGATQAGGGFGHTVVRRSDGSLLAVGQNNNGELGDGSFVERHTLDVVQGISGVTDIAVGDNHTVALTGDGKVWAWGDGAYYQLGSGTIDDSAVPTAVAGLSGVTHVGAGGRASLAINGSGAWFWGGAGGSGVVTHPTLIMDTAGATAVTGGIVHNLVLLNGVGLQLPDPVATTLSVTPGDDPALTGQPTTITFTVAPAPDMGTISGASDPAGPFTPIATVDPATGTATFEQTYASSGDHAAWYRFDGVPGFSASPVVPFTQTVVDPVVPDTTAPTVTGPTRGFVTGSTVTTGPAVKFAWSGTDTGSGVDRYEFAVKTDSGAYVTLSSSLTSATYTSALRTGHTYRARVRAIDVAGNTGAWVAGVSFRLTAYQESSWAIHWTSTWHTGSNTSFWGGHDRYATAAGAKASLTFTGRKFAWVGSVGRSRGWAKVYVNGVFVKSVNLYAATSAHRRVLFSTSWSSATSRTVTIRISGTAGHPRGDLDAFVVSS